MVHVMAAVGCCVLLALCLCRLSHSLPAAGLFFLNLMVDASFIVDMALQPFQSYWDEHHDT